MSFLRRWNENALDTPREVKGNIISAMCYKWCRSRHSCNPERCSAAGGDRQEHNITWQILLGRTSHRLHAHMGESAGELHASILARLAAGGVGAFRVADVIDVVLSAFDTAHHTSGCGSRSWRDVRLKYVHRGLGGQSTRASAHGHLAACEGKGLVALSLSKRPRLCDRVWAASGGPVAAAIAFAPMRGGGIMW